ncbi:glycosyltransferase [Mesoflavibacter zeaxanthinifaciens]|uniref:glycosyltransferase n=1 Tax=Mesoflavibacter zeaxanthinifaciens TaxID=393060 RepID=UPI003A95163A
MLKADISAVVVSCNEGHLLSNCLDSLWFCKEIIVIDLESTDNTKEIAEQYNANYILHTKVPYVEIIHTWIQNKVIYDWILITDPDEVCSKSLAKDILKTLPKLSENIGVVKVPWRFYYKKHLLKGTQWGGIQTRAFIVNKNRFYFTKDVHRGRHLKSGFKIHNIKYQGDNFVHHYWMSSLKQLIKKHKRYLKNEAESRYNNGERKKMNQVLSIPFTSFYSSFIKKRGVKDGFTGLFLSLFWAWYQTNSVYKLYRYMKSN